MSNKPRGETTMTVPGVGDLKLTVTLASMAMLEDEFEVENLEQALAHIGSNPGSRKMAVTIKALLQGTEHGEISIEEIRKWPITPHVIRDAIAAMQDANEGNAPKRKGKAKT